VPDAEPGRRVTRAGAHHRNSYLHAPNIDDGYPWPLDAEAKWCFETRAELPEIDPTAIQQTWLWIPTPQELCSFAVLRWFYLAPNAAPCGNGLGTKRCQTRTARERALVGCRRLPWAAVSPVARSIKARSNAHHPLLSGGLPLRR
jgi:hypothetical protein